MKMIRNFSEEHPHVIETELAKTQKQIDIIRLNDAIVTGFFNHFGFDFPPLFPEQVYIVPTRTFKKLKLRGISPVGHAIPYYGTITIDSKITNDPRHLGSVVRHEIIHLRGVMLYRPHFRQGFAIGEKFRGLTEMFVEFVTHSLHIEFLNEYPPFSKEREKYWEHIEKTMLDEKMLENSLGTNMYSTPLSKPGPERERITTLFIESSDEEGVPIMSGYHHLLNFFFCFLEEMGRKLEVLAISGIFPTFVKAYITGNLLPLGKMIEASFGRGAFRLLSTINPQDEWDIESFYRKLKK